MKIDKYQYGVQYGPVLDLQEFQHYDGRRVETIKQEFYKGKTVEKIEDVEKLFFENPNIPVNKRWVAHSAMVHYLAECIAEFMTMGRQESMDLRYAALLHDVGKILCYDPKALNRRGGLTSEESDAMLFHPEVGVEILKRLNEGDRLGINEAILAGVGDHHELYDGSGYPRGAVGKKISKPGRILAILDSVDACCGDRPYKKAPLSPAQIAQDIEANSGIKYDPDFCDAFLEMIRKDGKAFDAINTNNPVRSLFSFD
ncbi:MAG: HD domain-containing protein [Candidatus Aenigmarchaeota archaeon]|nr:HD domain-containing protein [Candidatus Aenigmarchaeota archaeon]